VVSLQFPPRDYQLLADIAIESLLSLGEAGKAALINMGHRIGTEMAKRAVAQSGIHPLFLKRIKVVHERERFLEGIGSNCGSARNACRLWK
ncbi:hypothetical protein SB776_36070, partial [Burkholderia sp. SIMBA_045]